MSGGSFLINISLDLSTVQIQAAGQLLPQVKQDHRFTVKSKQGWTVPEVKDKQSQSSSMGVSAQLFHADIYGIRYVEFGVVISPN